ncbi:hypothetical protein [Flavobacterium sp. LC2016-12]|uniref:hypothetical protein n=1 Tax=Flavobacterium sp. LC2016-12 TaxID=2783794 RepID=UPI00188C258E|nr:hypothetical protein [Flavobacterium sp. LC2016-12]MBF4466404.1 hypothetical protein [Flavobacterium sp. LC2016-12]
MQIEIITPNATQLREQIFKAVKNGSLETWKIAQSEDDKYLLTPVGAQFYNNILLRFEVLPFSKNLTIHPTHWRTQEQSSDALIAIVLGMITAALLTHFSTDFTRLETK